MLPCIGISQQVVSVTSQIYHVIINIGENGYDLQTHEMHMNSIRDLCCSKT